ncbi:fasciclin domain-containing protein [Sphingomonas jeddahensis]|uniref:Immunogenic protein MPT70 n=1 Tax=Sphingomonas jeddahensis TaxID=1915074 RepID=A0A1V2ESL2_9SPHN|nr:fasciclin domain-containing protein [Sphingomonas jeddahensis]ONF95465.1 Immunogenic protein MPT70 precursor [Sphingomonas jeddahensis]
MLKHREILHPSLLLTAVGVLGMLAACAQQPSQLAERLPAPQGEAVNARPYAVQPEVRRQPAQALAAAAATAINPYVGGTAMLGTRTIADNCAAAPNLRVLTRMVAASNAGRALSEAGPITVFAPTDAAFARLPNGAADQLLASANRPALSKVMSYHVVQGAITLNQVRARIDAGGGIARLPTVAGAPLTATKEGAAIALTDANGSKSYVETPDIQQVNGVVHVVNGVLVPQLG